MPQISLYVDEKTLRDIELRANLNNMSVSKFVVNAVNRYVASSWPKYFDSLPGSVSDDTFYPPESIPFSFDVRRETL
ncbi:MAG: hypothetical protein LBS92_03260 [Candidatus Methanoplasma sp.]|jgi:hypothetical protein|nr:hypothetical protein [Candidatus Methanoplasma sp.]